MQRFPEGFGTEINGKSFNEILVECPKWVEFARTRWNDNCTGMFLEFLQFIRAQFTDPAIVKIHEERCREYVKSLELVDIPTYLLKYKQ